MGRIRSVKPELFKHEPLWQAEHQTGLPLRLAYVGLWTCCDREGRFKWRPLQLKADILPHDDVDFSRVLDAWATRGFIVQYRVDGELYGYIPTFKKHQIINPRESASTIPPPTDNLVPNQELDAWGTREARVGDACHKEVKGKEVSKPNPPTPLVGSDLQLQSQVRESRPELFPVNGQAAPEKRDGKKFVKPTLAEVAAYCAERKNAVDAEQWFDHYEANGWRVGKVAMKDWKAAVRTWEKNHPVAPKPIAPVRRKTLEEQHRELMRAAGVKL